MSMKDPQRKKFVPIGSSLKDLKAMPVEIQKAFGGALGFAQDGEFPEGSTAFGEGLPSHVKKISEDLDGETYRAAFVVAFPKCVYLLDVFQKKSPSGKRTPRPVLSRIKQRYDEAKQHYAANSNQM